MEQCGARKTKSDYSENFRQFQMLSRKISENHENVFQSRESQSRGDHIHHRVNRFVKKFIFINRQINDQKFQDFFAGSKNKKRKNTVMADFQIFKKFP